MKSLPWGSRSAEHKSPTRVIFGSFRHERCWKFCTENLLWLNLIHHKNRNNSINEQKKQNPDNFFLTF